METTTHLSPSTHMPDTMAAHSNDFLISSPPLFDDSADTAGTPPPVIVHSKPAKKRKSWGQQLPEPTTSLPPRKRAKTEDEKEQRRIERIKRNRAAAHNSRERKRQETETYAVALARAQAELAAYKKLYGQLPASVVLPEVTVSADSADTPAPSLTSSHASVAATASPPSPTLHDNFFDANITIKQEEPELADPTLFPDFTTLDSKPQPQPSSTLSLPLALDPTQHSAAMLCDLQCRSSQPQRQHQQSRINRTTTSPAFWATLFLYLTTIQMQATYKTLMVALWTLSPSRMARTMQASTARSSTPSTTSSMTPLLSRSTLALAQRNAATGHGLAQGAFTALQRASLAESQRKRVGSAATSRKQRLDSLGREALGETQDGDDDVGREVWDGVRRSDSL